MLRASLQVPMKLSPTLTLEKTYDFIFVRAQKLAMLASWNQPIGKAPHTTQNNGQLSCSFCVDLNHRIIELSRALIVAISCKVHYEILRFVLKHENFKLRRNKIQRKL